MYHKAKSVLPSWFCSHFSMSHFPTSARGVSPSVLVMFEMRVSIKFESISTSKSNVVVSSQQSQLAFLPSIFAARLVVRPDSTDAATALCDQFHVQVSLPPQILLCEAAQVRGTEPPSNSSPSGTDILNHSNGRPT